MALGNKMIKFLTEKARAERRALNVNMELLPICNLDCRMCYIRSSWKCVKEQGGLIPKEKWIALVKELYQAGVLFLLLTGGEVFLYPEFKELYIELVKMGFGVTINTNATMIQEETVEWLKQYPPKLLSISLYGADNETYEKVCGRKGVFDQVNHALKLLLEANIQVECKTILTPLNYENLEKCNAYMLSLGIPYDVAVYSFPAVRKLEEAEQIRFTAREAADCIFYRNRIMSGTQEAYDEEIIRYLKKYEETRFTPGKVNCGLNCSGANTAAWISWQGHMTPCAMLNEPYTLPFEQGFLPAWEELKEKTDKLVLSTKCSYCEKRQVCTVCPASACAETGRIDGTSEYHCEMTDRIIETMQCYVQEKNLKIHEEE